MSTPGKTPVSDAAPRPNSERPSEFSTLEALPVTVPKSDVSEAASFVVRLLPATDPTAPVMLVLPAIALKAKFYLPLAKSLHEAGFSSATVDLRAQGESTPPLGEARNYGYRQMLEADLPAILDALHDRFPEAPIFLVGHSLGGQLSLLYGAAHPDQLAGVITIATGVVYWRAFDPKRWASVLYGSQYVGVVSRLRGIWPGGKVMGGPMAGGVMVDWSWHALTGRYRPAGTKLNYDRLLGDSPLRTLMVSFESDPLGPKSTVDHLAGRLKAAQLTRWHLGPDSGLENLDHFAWIKDSPSLGARFAEWVREGR
ncbi:alpha/beta fold hydrolase [Nocardia uniformis]|uniref:Alpha/beta fold hydrolase n=1 Tax=Nocardia uniformis TaxID=53432 RepID=A0A849C023_9NOCA|nr:alpha/beta fold hydrolase [Nocardia uniformis]NNH68359.1 alpha/beta fold hydrolase [Nocardia uniformis]